MDSWGGGTHFPHQHPKWGILKKWRGEHLLHTTQTSFSLFYHDCFHS